MPRRTAQLEQLERRNGELAQRNRELAQRNRELAQRNRELAAGTEAKSRFVANLSHELRTPLNAVLGFSELLHEGRLGPLAESQREPVGIIHSSAEHLLTLIDEASDLSRIEAGCVRLEPEAIEPWEIVAECARSLRRLAADRAIRVQLDLRPVGAIQLDPARLRQVILNYLANAIKFTPTGGTVTIELEREPEQLLVTVSDTGPGISAAERERVFEPFVQLPGADQAGSGLGLAITKLIVEAQGGSVGVRSRPGQGSTFFAALPAPRGPGDARVAMPVSRPGPVLVIEDHPLNRRLVEQVLALERIETLAAGSIAQAERVLERTLPSVIVLDLQLPDGHGLDLARRVKADPRTRRCAIVACTAAAGHDEERLVLAAGCSGYVSKPIDGRRLASLVMGLLAAPSANRSGFELPASSLAGSSGAGRLGAGLTDQSAHPVQPALGLGALERHVAAHVGVREDQEALLPDPGHHRLGDVVGLEQAAGQ